MQGTRDNGKICFIRKNGIGKILKIGNLEKLGESGEPRKYRGKREYSLNWKCIEYKEIGNL